MVLNHSDLREKIKVLLVLDGSVKICPLHVMVDNMILGEVFLGPFLQTSEDLLLVAFLGETLATEIVRSIAEVVACSIFVLDLRLQRSLIVVSDEEAPGTSVVHIHIQLLRVVIMLEFGSVNPDNISNSLDDRELLEGLGEEDNVYYVELSALSD